MSAARLDAQLKNLFGRLRRRFGHLDGQVAVDPVEELLIGILGRDISQSRARTALARLKEAMVDFNELRIAAPADIVDELGTGFPGARQKSRAIIALLGGIYDRIDCLDLSFLKAKPKREVEKWLSELPGVDRYAVGRTMLLCFGAHAVPVNRPILAWLQAEGILDASLSIEEAQGVLTRHIRATEALEVFNLLHRWAEETPKRSIKSARFRKKKTKSRRKVERKKKKFSKAKAKPSRARSLKNNRRSRKTER